MSNTVTKEFCQMHRINVVDQNKRAHKMTKMNTKFFQYSDDYNKFQQEHFTFDTETLYTIEISESELERIAEFENQVFNNLKQTGHYRLFENLMEQKEEEAYLRDKYPAVRKAYEQYSLILSLSKSGEL
jgi:hypothetical protein